MIDLFSHYPIYQPFLSLSSMKDDAIVEEIEMFGSCLNASAANMTKVPSVKHF